MPINSITGVKVWIAFIKDIPRGAKEAAMRAITTHVIGNDARGLKHEPAYKHITRKAAGLKTSDKQRRFLFATGIWRSSKFGGVAVRKHVRTHGYRNAWRQEPQTSDWRRVDIVNRSKGAGYVGGANQARMLMLGGWRKATAIVQTNIKGAIQAGQRAVDKWIAERK